MTMPSDSHFATAAEAARILGVTRGRVLELAASAPDFPAAEPTATGGRIWPRLAIEAWAAAHQDRGPRYAAAELPPAGRWPRQVHQVASLAAEEARALHHGWVGRDHLVLALVRPDCPGAAPAVLASFGVTAEPLRAAVVAGLGDSHDRKVGEGTIWSPAAQLLLERASLEAILLFDAAVASEHVLLALTSQWNGSFATGWLARCGIGPQAVRQRAVDVTEGVPLPAPTPLAAPPEFDPAAGLELAPTPDGHDPRKRRPWGWMVLVDADGRPLRQGYLIDRDGHPLLTIDGRPVDVLIDEQGQPVLDAEGRVRIRPVEIPSGSQIQVWRGRS
ncbi:MAG TPA: Clp protease N-terminal domain-containing protein [Actinomycetes bacterium]